MATSSRSGVHGPCLSSFETEESEAERKALEWLEQQAPPALVASSFNARSCPTSYVPVNDVAIPRLGKKAPSPEQIKAGLSMLPEFRPRQPRQFPIAIPDNPIVYLIWPESHLPEMYRQIFENLCRKVTYMGHSASLVQVWIEDNPPPVTPEPTPVEQGRSRHRLRVTPSGRLEYLRKQFEAGLRPHRRCGEDMTSHEKSFPLRLSRTRSLMPYHHPPTPGRAIIWIGDDLAVDRSMRGAVMTMCPQPVPEWISAIKSMGREASSHT